MMIAELLKGEKFNSNKTAIIPALKGERVRGGVIRQSDYIIVFDSGASLLIDASGSGSFWAVSAEETCKKLTEELERLKSSHASFHTLVELLDTDKKAEQSSDRVSSFIETLEETRVNTNALGDAIKDGHPPSTIECHLCHREMTNKGLDITGRMTTGLDEQYLAEFKAGRAAFYRHYHNGINHEHLVFHDGVVWCWNSEGATPLNWYRPVIP